MADVLAISVVLRLYLANILFDPKMVQLVCSPWYNKESINVGELFKDF